MLDIGIQTFSNFLPVFVLLYYLLTLLNILEKVNNTQLQSAISKYQLQQIYCKQIHIHNTQSHLHSSYVYRVRCHYGLPHKWSSRTVNGPPDWLCLQHSTFAIFSPPFNLPFACVRIQVIVMSHINSSYFTLWEMNVAENVMIVAIKLAI